MNSSRNRETDSDDELSNTPGFHKSKRQRLNIYNDSDDDDNNQGMMVNNSFSKFDKQILASTRIGTQASDSSDYSISDKDADDDSDVRSTLGRLKGDQILKSNKLNSTKRHQSQRVDDGVRRSSRIPVFEDNDQNQISQRTNDPSSDGDEKREDGGIEMDEDMLDRLRKMSKTSASKRVVKTPRRKLDPQRLLNDCGLPSLLKDFQSIRFLEKGFEFQNLNKLLYVYESWAHRLMPGQSFPEIIERLENLGSRREIHVALHRLRNGIWPPCASNERVSDESDDSNVENNIPEEDAWQQAMHSFPKQKPLTSPNVSVVCDTILHTPVSPTSTSDIGLSDPLICYPSSHNSSIAGSSLVDTTLELRIEMNKRLAQERLKASRQSKQMGLNSIDGLTKLSSRNILKSALNSSLNQSPKSSNSRTTPATICHSEESN